MLWRTWWIDDIIILIYLFVFVVISYVGIVIVMEIGRRMYQVIFVRHYDADEWKRMFWRKISIVRNWFRRKRKWEDRIENRNRK